MREKLIELLGEMYCGHLDFEGCETCDYRYEEDCQAKAFADHLLANGVIVLPCRLGDTVWGIQRYSACGWKAKPGKVYQMYYGEDMRLCISVKRVCLGQWGKQVFATREEAEAALPKEV